jgi:hypothetical protein
MITQSKADRQTSGCCSTVCEIGPDERAGGVDLSDPLLAENAFMGAGGRLKVAALGCTSPHTAQASD